MDVILGARGIIKVDDKLDIVDVKTSGSDVRSNENRRLPQTKLIQNLREGDVM